MQQIRSRPNNLSTALRQLLRHGGIRLALVQRALIPPTTRMQHKRRACEPKEQEQAVERQCLSLEYRLHEGYVYEAQLGQERYGHCCNQHPILCEATSEPAVLDRRDEVKENEAGECLREGGTK